MKARTFGAAALCAIALVSASCSSSSGSGGDNTTGSGAQSASPASSGNGSAAASATGKKLTITYANYTNNSTLFGPIVDGVKKAAATGGMTLKLYDNKADDQTALQNAQLMVQAHPDVVIEYSPDPSIANSLGAVFTNAKVPCIALNIVVTGCAWLNIVNQELGSAAGVIAANYSKQHGWDGTNSTVLLAGSPKVGDEVTNTIRYLYLTLSKLVSGYKQIDAKDFTLSTTKIADNAIVIDAGSSADTAFNAVQSALQNIPKSRHIIFSSYNDDLASGGWRAISQAGRAGNSIVIGEGGSETALKSLQTDPGWAGEIDALLSVWGYYAVAMADALADGAKAPALTQLPFVPLTKANLAKYYSTSDLAHPKALPPPVPSNKYLWGRGILESYGK